MRIRVSAPKTALLGPLPRLKRVWHLALSCVRCTDDEVVAAVRARRGGAGVAPHRWCQAVTPVWSVGKESLPLRAGNAGQKASTQRRNK